MRRTRRTDTILCLVFFGILLFSQSCTRPYTRTQSSGQSDAPTYLVSIPHVLIAPSDQQGESWDTFAAPTAKLRKYRQQFDERTQHLPDQQCWLDTNHRWTCVPNTKMPLPLFLPTIFIIYKWVSAAARAAGTYRPDPLVELQVGNQKVTYPIRQDTFHPKWEKPIPLQIHTGDLIQVHVFDSDALGQKQSIAQFTIPFQPSTESLRSGLFKFIYNRSINLKLFTLLFAAQSTRATHAKK